MKSLYGKYFSGVRWVELALVMGIATLADLQLKVQAGIKLDQSAFIESGLKGLGAGLIYLRVPKGSEEPAPVAVDGLPPGVDATGPADDIPATVAEAAVKAALGPIGAAAPDLAGDIVAEMGRVLRRGIRL